MRKRMPMIEGLYRCGLQANLDGRGQQQARCNYS